MYIRRKFILDIFMQSKWQFNFFPLVKQWVLYLMEKDILLLTKVFHVRYFKFIREMNNIFMLNFYWKFCKLRWAFENFWQVANNSCSYFWHASFTWSVNFSQTHLTTCSIRFLQVSTFILTLSRNAVRHFPMLPKSELFFSWKN
jgi:hypothetical protein